MEPLQFRVMISRVYVQVIAALVVAVFAAGIWLSGDAVRVEWLRFYSIAVVVALIAIAAWVYILWRLPPSQRLPKVPRDITGTWKGCLRSLWRDPQGRQIGEKTAYLVVRQSVGSISTVLLTDESRSDSSLATVSVDGATQSLDYLYLNRPSSRHDERSRMHHGSASLDIVGNPAIRLTGRYWTDRDSRGELIFRERATGLADDYEAAEALFRTREEQAE